MIIFVTGATAGFGESITRRFIENGHKVIATGRRAERLKALKDELGDSLYTVQLDVRNRVAIEEAVAQLPAEWRNIDVLVNNAGLALGIEPAHKANVEDWENMIDTNTKGLVYMTRALLPQMLERRRGALVNIASTSAYQPTPSMAGYGASKAFVLSFTEAIAYETRRSGLKVVAVSPGPMRTEFFDKLGTTRPGVGRWQTPEQVVDFTLRTLDPRRPRPSVISGALNAVPIAAARFTPRRLVLAITGRAIGA